MQINITGHHIDVTEPLRAYVSEKITKLKAICVVCGKNAHFTQRIINGKPAKYDDPIILVGAQECYEARCRECYSIDKPAQLYTPKITPAKAKEQEISQ